MRTKLFSIILFPIMLAGCGSTLYNLRWGEDKQPISYFNPTNKKSGTLLAVTANAATVYINQEGKVCIDPADVYRTKNREDSFTGKLGNAGDAAKQIKIEGLDLATLNKITESAQLLNSASPATTLFQSGSLGICQLVINGAPSEAYTAYIELLKSSSEVEKARYAQPSQQQTSFAK